MLRQLRFQIVVAVIWFLAACPFQLFAQTGTTQPITLLPKPPSANATAPAKASTHPITTLPRPADDIAPVQPPAPAASATVSPVTQPAYLPTSSTQPPIVTPNLSSTPLRVAINPTIESTPQRQSIRAFSAVGVQIKAGFAGIGIDVATPLAQHFNLRASGSFVPFNAGYYIDGLTLDGQVRFRSATASLDWYPFHNGFRMSPGVTLYNGNSLNGTLSVPGGQSFDLGDGTYTSSPTDPVHGVGSMSFGRRTAPSFTVGWGNMIPRSGGRFSMPFEVGFQYIGAPKINFKLMGTACDNQGCDSIATDPGTQADLQQELTDINNQITPLRFYPIISIGLAWAFGSHGAVRY
jgi:hypothetical protein